MRSVLKANYHTHKKNILIGHHYERGLFPDLNTIHNDRKNLKNTERFGGKR